MGWKKMDVVPVPDGNPNNPSYECEVSLAAAGDSDWFLIPAGVKRVSVAVNPGGGASAAVVITLSKVSTVKSGTGIVEEVWPSGAVVAYASDWVVPVTAVLLRQGGAGTSSMMVRAQ